MKNNYLKKKRKEKRKMMKKKKESFFFNIPCPFSRWVIMALDYFIKIFLYAVSLNPFSCQIFTHIH